MATEPQPHTIERDIGHAINLMAHPMAGFAAASAIGLGMTMQVAGLWIGAVTGAMQSAQRMAEGFSGPVTTPSQAVERARAATRTLMADADMLAREVADVAPRMASAAAPVSGERKPARQKQVKTAAKQMFARPTSVDRPAVADDLKAISGVGPKLEQVLNGLGVWNYAQIAGWGDAEIAWVDDQLGFSGRIERDDWVGQAERLTGNRRDG